MVHTTCNAGTGRAVWSSGLALAALVLALALPWPAAATLRGPGPPPVPVSLATRAPTDGVWPLSPEPDVVAGFDPPTSRWGPGHRGVDLAGDVGQQVRAAQGGTVSFAGRIAGRGVVVVAHGGTRTTYEPVAATVTVGDEVGAGDPIGRLELLGSHCLPRACLHWGLLRGDTYLDPLTLVGGGPVRLLPWSGTGSIAPVSSVVGEPLGVAALFRG